MGRATVQHMSANREIAALQACVANRLNTQNMGNRKIAGVIGAAPSHYSKSPALWNAVFSLLGMHAIYLPFDVDNSELKEFASVLRNTESALGINVTVPHKLAIMDYLDELDPAAARVDAVNTVVRSIDGRLVGYNTDGDGFVESILRPQPGQRERFVESLSGADVLLLGAGGSARAVAFHVSELMNNGKLFVCNRTIEPARELAEAIRNAGYLAQAIGENELSHWAPRVALIINSTSKGQGGSFALERYSALAPAMPDGGGAGAEEKIKANNDASLRLARVIPEAVRFYDLIYHPEETVFLRHGRETGHRTMNGKAMIVCQAAIALCSYICKKELVAKGLDPSVMLSRITETMHQAW